MGLTLDRVQRCLVLLAPLVAIAVAAPNPVSAATFAISEANVKLDQFSHQPAEVDALVDKESSITGSATVGTAAQAQFVNGSLPPATAGIDAQAKFVNDSLLPSAQNLSVSGAIGDGIAHTGMARSFAQVMGRNFEVGAGEIFAFNFDANLALSTKIDQPGYEAATANGLIQFELFDSTDDANPILLDFFAFFGDLNTPGTDDELDQVVSNYVMVVPNQRTFLRSFGGNEESAKASVQGTFARQFERATRLTLVETKENKVTVTAPEPISTPSVLFGGVAMMTKLMTKRRKQATKAA
jgi:hypothetical protein